MSDKQEKKDTKKPLRGSVEMPAYDPESGMTTGKPRPVSDDD